MGTTLTTLYVPKILSNCARLTCYLLAITTRIPYKALSWAPHGNLLASTFCDQTVRVFDIYSMKEWVVLRGHKKEAFCAPYLLLYAPRPDMSLTPSPLNSPGISSCALGPRLRWHRRCHPGTSPPRQQALSVQFSQLPHHGPLPGAPHQRGILHPTFMALE